MSKIENKEEIEEEKEKIDDKIILDELKKINEKIENFQLEEEEIEEEKEDSNKKSIIYIFVAAILVTITYLGYTQWRKQNA